MRTVELLVKRWPMAGGFGTKYSGLISHRDYIRAHGKRSDYIICEEDHRRHGKRVEFVPPEKYYMPRKVDAMRRGFPCYDLTCAVLGIVTPAVGVAAAEAFRELDRSSAPFFLWHPWILGAASASVRVPAFAEVEEAILEFALARLSRADRQAAEADFI